MGQDTIRVFNYYGGTFGHGGVEAFLTNVSQEMREHGVEFIIAINFGYSNGNIYKEKLEQNKVQVIEIHEHKVGFIRSHIDLMKYIHKNLRKEDILVVHASNAAAYLSAFAARLCGIKHVLFHLHGTQNNEPVGLARKTERALCDLLFKRASEMRIAPSNEAGESFFKGLSFTVVHNGIDTDRFRFDEKTRNDIRKRMGIENQLVIGQVARMVYPKNQRFTVDLAAALREQGVDCCAVFVGDGPKKEELLAHIHEKKMEDAVYILPPTDQVQEYYSAFDIFAFPSLFEGLGIVAIEAQAAGLPILCSDRVPDEVMLTRYIWRIPLSEPAAWVERICAIMAQGLDRSQVSEEGIQAISAAGFTSEGARQELISIYSAMLGATQPGTKQE